MTVTVINKKSLTAEEEEVLERFGISKGND